MSWVGKRRSLRSSTTSTGRRTRRASCCWRARPASARRHSGGVASSWRRSARTGCSPAGPLGRRPNSPSWRSETFSRTRSKRFCPPSRSLNPKRWGSRFSWMTETGQPLISARSRSRSWGPCGRWREPGRSRWPSTTSSGSILHRPSCSSSRYGVSTGRGSSFCSPCGPSKRRRPRSTSVVRYPGSSYVASGSGRSAWPPCSGC